MLTILSPSRPSLTQCNAVLIFSISLTLLHFPPLFFPCGVLNESCYYESALMPFCKTATTTLGDLPRRSPLYLSWKFRGMGDHVNCIQRGSTVQFHFASPRPPGMCRWRKGCPAPRRSRLLARPAGRKLWHVEVMAITSIAEGTGKVI